MQLYWNRHIRLLAFHSSIGSHCQDKKSTIVEAWVQRTCELSNMTSIKTFPVRWTLDLDYLPSKYIMTARSTWCMQLQFWLHMQLMQLMNGETHWRKEIIEELYWTLSVTQMLTWAAFAQFIQFSEAPQMTDSVGKSLSQLSLISNSSWAFFSKLLATHPRSNDFDIWFNKDYYVRIRI